MKVNINLLLLVVFVGLVAVPALVVQVGKAPPKKQESETEAALERTSRDLLFWPSPSVAIQSPSNDHSTAGADSLEVQVSYDAKNPFFAFFTGFNGLKVLMDDDVLEEKSFGLFGKNSGTETFDIELGGMPVGEHSLSAEGRKFWLWPFFSTSVTSELVVVNVAPNLPASVQNFIDDTFIPGLSHDESSTIEEADGKQYQVDANITIIETGLVSLTKEQPLIDQVECLLDGSVRFDLSEAIDSVEIAQFMFPTGAILTIDSDVYGECRLEEEELQVERNLTSYSDGFLVIQNVSLSPDGKQVDIIGSPTSWVFLFDEADIKIDPIDGYGRSLLLGNRTMEVRSLAEATFSASRTFGAAPLRLNAGAEVTVGVGIGTHIKVGWRSGVTLSLNLGVWVSASASITFEAESSQSARKEDDGEAELLRFGIPGLSLPKVPILDIVSPKLGAYIVLDYFWEYMLNSNKALTAGAKISAGTGYKQVSFWVNGGWTGLSAGVSVTRYAYKCFRFLRMFCACVRAFLLTFCLIDSGTIHPFQTLT